nr:MAG: ORF1 [TTV-like mini virus]
MPWYNYWPRRRRLRRYWRRPRKTLRRRYWRRPRWVRRPYKRKLRKIVLTQFQPKTIRKSKIKGPICLFQTTNKRLVNNFDMYETSEVPEHQPGGGGWGIKVFTLEGLYSEHIYGRNIWTVTNQDLPLVRYLGCSIRFYQSEYTDYVATYSNQLPLQSSLGMYNAMQPNIHLLLKNKITMPGLKTYKRKVPYKKVFVPPPTQLENKWYFQQNIAKTPLLMTRVTACSLNKFYIDPDHINTNLTITSLNVSLFSNRQFQDATDYHPKTVGTINYYLYSTTQNPPYNGPLKLKMLIPLTDTMIYKPGINYEEYKRNNTTKGWNDWKTEYTIYSGNPFHANYLSVGEPVFLIGKKPSDLFSSEEGETSDYTTAELTKTIRYNPYNDQGQTNICYFKANFKSETTWQPPDNPDLTNENLPFWLLLWGFSDWHKKIKKHLHIDSSYILVMRHIPLALNTEYIVPLSDSFLQGKSPFSPEEQPIGADRTTWHPQFQHQAEAINTICSSGPGTTKIPDNYSVQGLMKYSFYFKWGGSPPPMSTIEDPIQQPTYPVPHNFNLTTSLQNPETDPASILWSFDQRRHTLTKKAIERLQKDTGIKTITVTGGSHFDPTPTISQEETSEESSEEEEETSLLEKLQQQQRQQRRLKLRIMKTLLKIQQLE